MTTVIKQIVIPNDRRIAIDLPSDFPAGEVVVTLTIEPRNIGEKPENRLGELFGQGKGEIWMADDFDAPLDDFKEYM